MLTLQKAKNQAQYDELLAIISHQNITCLQAKLDWVQLACENFGEYFQTTGCAYRVCWDGELVGLCWIEKSGWTLYVRGLIIKPEQQGRGFGQGALRNLEKIYQHKARWIELSVHASNPRAMALYDRLGFGVVYFSQNSGFYRMRKQCLVGKMRRAIGPASGRYRLSSSERAPQRRRETCRQRKTQMIHSEKHLAMD
jgi:ribosomal protein S18 acetylase RimI-like enzyme